MADDFKESAPHFGPCSEKQKLLLTDFETDIVLAGGGAGSGGYSPV